MPSKKRPADADVDPRPTKIARHSPEWQDPLPQSESAGYSSAQGINAPSQPQDDPVSTPSPPHLIYNVVTIIGQMPSAAVPVVTPPTVPTASPEPDPHPSASYADAIFPSHVEETHVKTRLLDELRFTDQDKSRYNIGLSPDDLRWGIATNGKSASFECYLCTSTPTKPLVIRIIGSIRFLQTKNDRLNIGVEPLAAFDAQRAKAIQNGKARPSRPPAKSALIYASKFLNGNPFQEAYDATDVLLPWPEMQDYKIPVRRIRTTDIVLLECLVRRYPPSDAPYGSGWDRFSIAFELARAASLVIGPGIPDYLPE